MSAVRVRKASLWIIRISFLLRSLCKITAQWAHNPGTKHLFLQHLVCVTECLTMCVWLILLTVNGEQRDLGKCPCQFVEYGCAESFCRLKTKANYCLYYHNCLLLHYNLSVKLRHPRLKCEPTSTCSTLTSPAVGCSPGVMGVPWSHCRTDLWCRKTNSFNN